MPGRPCKFYRNSESLHMGRGLGYCDLDCNNAICEGDAKFCEKLDALRTVLLKEKAESSFLSGGVRGLFREMRGGL